MSEQTPTQPKLSEVAKNPGTYLLMFTVAMAGYLLRSFTSSSDSRAADWRERSEQCEVRLEREQDSKAALQRDYNALTNDLLITNEIIKAVPQMADPQADTTKPKRR